MWEYRAKLTGQGQGPTRAAVHDGDTIRFVIDLGMDVRVEKWIRLGNVRAPELSQPGGQEALVEAVNWCLVRTITNAREWPFRIRTEQTAKPEPDERTSFQRYIGYVYDIVTNECLNTEINVLLASHPEWPRGE